MPNKLAKIRNVAFRLQSHRCYYCRLPMWQDDPAQFAQSLGISLKQAAQLKCTAEHLTARQDGGRDARANIVAACWHCNRTRHKRLKPLAPERYKELVLRRIQGGRWHGTALLSKLMP